MKSHEFTTIYKQAQQTTLDKIKEIINVYWLLLSEKQHKQMYKLMLEKGATEVEIKGIKYIEISKCFNMRKL